MTNYNQKPISAWKMADLIAHEYDSWVSGAKKAPEAPKRELTPAQCRKEVKRLLNKK
jgi:hypothetical protein